MRERRNPVPSVSRAEPERLTTAVIDAMGDGLILIGMDGKITSVNLAWEKMTGYEKSEVVGKDAAEVAQKMHKPEDVKKLIGALRTAMGGKVPTSLVYTLIRKDGQEISLTYTPSFIRGAEGKPTQIVGTIKDITELKKAEEARVEVAAARARAAEAEKHTKELAKKVEQLETFTRVTVDRELKMVELKKRINELEEKLEDKS